MAQILQGAAYGVMYHSLPNYNTTALVTTMLLTRPLKDIMEVVEREHIPSYNFRPKEEDKILVRTEGETYFSRARGVKMPSQAIVAGLTSCQSQC